MALKPAATNASSSLNEEGSSTVHPNTFPPKTSGEISSPEFPSLRLFIAILSIGARRIYLTVLDEIPRSKGTRRPRGGNPVRGLYLLALTKEGEPAWILYAGPHVKIG